MLMKLLYLLVIKVLTEPLKMIGLKIDPTRPLRRSMQNKQHILTQNNDNFSFNCDFKTYWVFYNEQEAHGPHRAPPKTVQINKHI